MERECVESTRLDFPALTARKHAKTYVGTLDGERVVVKVLNTLRPTAEIRSTASRLAGMSDGSLVRVVAFQVYPPALCTEYCARWSLSDTREMVPQRFTTRLALEVARDILGGLAHLHHAGVVHARFYPSNVLLTAEFRAKLADPAFSVFSTPLTLCSAAQAVFLPDEVLNNNAQPRSDVFSWALVTYFALTGAPPQRSGTSPPASVHCDDGEVEMVLNECIARDVTARPDVAGLQEEVGYLLAAHTHGT